MVGEIVDEYDTETPMVQELEGGQYLVDARMSVDDLNDLLDVTLPDDEWDTVGGLVLGLAGRVPIVGERFELDGAFFTPERVQRPAGRAGPRRQAIAPRTAFVKSGFVAVVGRPNVGKSTLVNGLVGHKVSIISSRPQTTRNTIRGVLTIGTPEPETQIVFVDTPGLGKPKNVLGERLNSVVHRTLAEVDAVLFVLDATRKIGPGDRRIAERLLGLSQVTVIAVINKGRHRLEGPCR